MTPQQCKAARSLLGWNQSELAHYAGVGRSTVTDHELQSREVSAKLVGKLKAALEAAGIQFINKTGAKLKG